MSAGPEANAKTAGEAPLWHQMSVEAAAERLGANSERGLASEEAARRLAQDGPNAIRERGRRSHLAMAAAQFTDFMILVLIAAALVSGIAGDVEDAVVIVAIVLLNGAVGFVQDFRAERAMEALKRLAALKAVVLRDGQRRAIDATQIVRGDVVLLEAGASVPADLRLIEAPRLKLGEAALTGEAVPVEKSTAPLSDPALALADRTNMAFKGTVATYGRARGVVVATGMATELGKIAGLLETAGQPKTPLQRRLAGFGRQLALAVLAVCALIFGAGVLRGESALLMLLTALSLAVAAIPEALPAVVTVMLALGARNMARRKALVRRLPSVESLGSISCICTDKTGTLTLNEMRAAEIYLAGERRPTASLDPRHPAAVRLLTAMALCNDAGRDEHGAIVGDPTEVALLRAAAESGFEKRALEHQAPRRMELPFDSERKRMTTFHEDRSGFIAYTKGAPESVLDRLRAASDEGEGADDDERLRSATETMARAGLRVLAVACRRWEELPRGQSAATIERELTLLGLVGLLDPPRPEAREAVARCKSAGITPVMITGDHPVTARAIADVLGIRGEEGTLLTGAELARLSDAELARRIESCRVFARVDPAQKIRIVSAFQADGRFVAMTGDGVNDAPALARADVGVAMGKVGTDVAREAASLVLLDDNFATIVAAVEEGRRIFDNIRKFINYALTCNSAEIWTILLAPFLGLPMPLLPIHILWINLVTDGLPGLALAAEPPEAAIMRRAPRPAGESIFAHGMWQHILWVGLTMAGVTLLTQAYAIHLGDARWQTMVFTVLTLSQMGNVLAIRSQRDSFLTQGPLSNPALLGAVLLTVLLQLTVIYLPVLNPVFHTQPLSLLELAVCLLLSSVVFVVIEIEKWFVRRGLLYR